MLISTLDLLHAARVGGYAVGAFNVYNMEGVQAVVAAAESEHSSAMLQVHPGALQHGGAPLIALCLEAARMAHVPLAVHLDHASSPPTIEAALLAGVSSVMADGSHLPYAENRAFTRAMADLAHKYKVSIEAELGRLSGTEDGLTVHDYEARLTAPDQAADFVAVTGADMLAVCIGNVHGHSHNPPQLDFTRLAAIQQAVDVPLVLHGASGLTNAQIQQSIALGICKFNVNTEVRAAYLTTLRAQLAAHPHSDLVELMRHAVHAMQDVVVEKMRLFRSTGTADRVTDTPIQQK